MTTGSFNRLDLRDIRGYKITAHWTPQQGFQGNFFVYVMEKAPPGSRFEQDVCAGAGGMPTRGRLHLRSNRFDYQFNNIDLVSAKGGATRSFRHRLLEFRYAPAVTGAGETPIRIMNDDLRGLALGPLENDFDYSLDGGHEHLLGYTAYRANVGNSVVRFSTLRNSQNCFLEKLIQANNELNYRGGFTSFNVECSRQQYVVTPANLAAWHIDESYGTLLAAEPLALEEFAVGGLVNLQALRLRPADYTNDELLQFDFDRSVDRSHAGTVEAATFAFHNGNYQYIV